MSLIDKVVIVTATDSGMGACKSRVFVKEGAQIVATDVDGELVIDGGTTAQ